MIRGAKAVFGAWIAAAVLACGPPLEIPEPGLARFVDTPLIVPTAQVLDLDVDVVVATLTDVVHRFESYLALRAAIPISALVTDGCFVELPFDDGGFSAEVDIPCVFGDGQVAAGAIFLQQRQLQAGPPEVSQLDLAYADVQVGSLHVSGSESITETLADQGASLRTLEVIQDGEVLSYTFQFGEIAESVQIFDYPVLLESGQALVRLTPATTLGGYATATIIGGDGSLVCEVRNTDHQAESTVKGTCAGGLVFGL